MSRSQRRAPSDSRAGRPPPRRSGRWKQASRSIAALALLAGAVWLLSREVDPAALRAALAGADHRLVLLLAATHLAVLVPLKAWRWKVMLAPVRRLPFTTLYRYVFAGYAVGNLFPARAGQAARVVLLTRHAVPVTGSVGVLVVEEISNAVAVGAIALPLPFLLELPAAARVSLGVVSGGATFALVLLVALAVVGRARGGWLRRVSEGVAILGNVRTAALVLAMTAAIWVVDLGQISLAMASVGVAPSYAGVALVLLFVNLTNALPATPGQLGLFEGAATAGCVATGATAEEGLAVGIVYHMMQFVPDTSIGLAVLGLRALRRTPGRASDAPSD
jgi:glycosyltransferase AglD